MDLNFRVFAYVSKPVEQVFEAVANPDQLSHYFTTGGAKGRLETGATVTWDFHDFPGAFPVQVIEVVPNERITLEWKANDAEGAPYNTRVVMSFEAIDKGGWRETETGLKSAFGNCMGWSQMLCALKAWVERGINLREGLYV
jgi:uncharacterized protein YndB with AHSA1/START domain